MSMTRRRLFNEIRFTNEMPDCGNTAYCSLIPSSGSYTGKLFRINLSDGSLTRIKIYPSYYFSSMEYIDGKFYVFCNDFTKGFGEVDVNDGTYTRIFTIKKGITDMSYDSTNEALYGLRYGKIWSLSVTSSSPVQLYDGSLYFMAIAVNGGDMYAITQETTGVSFLYRFRGCDFTQQPEVIMGIALSVQYTQSMAFVPGTRILYWTHVCAGCCKLVCIDLTDLQDPKIIGSIPLDNGLGGLVIMDS